jgi:predicted PurR-regulated permease PerM
VTSSTKELPGYLKGSVFFLGIVAFFAILYIAQGIIVPLIFAVIIAILLNPAVRMFERIGIHRIIAIAITIILTFVIIASIGLLIYVQIRSFSESWPMLVDRFTEIINQSTLWFSGYFEIDPQKIQDWIANSKSELIDSSGYVIGQTLLSLGSILVVLFLVPVYVFILLLYKPLLIEFIHRLFISKNQNQVAEIITQIKTVIQRYLGGLVIEAVIVATLDAIALFILGIEYAIMLAIFAALLNIIPYIGGIVAVALPMMVAIATEESAWYAVYVLIAYYIIQLIDNNYIVPKIVASKVKINALFSIIVVLAGNALWGIPGMFLSLPLLAIVKLIFDHVDSLKPWGFLLGDTMPPILKLKPILKKLKQVF